MKIILSVAIILTSITVFSQRASSSIELGDTYTSPQMSIAQKEDFSVESLGSKYTEKELKMAIQKADWCGYLNANEKVKLTFDDGAIVFLLSKNDFKGNEPNEECYKNTANIDRAVYSIHSTGVIIRRVSANKFKKG